MKKPASYSKRVEEGLALWHERYAAEQAAAAKAGTPLGDDTQRKHEAWKLASAKLLELRAAAARWREIRAEVDAAWKTLDGDPADTRPAARAAGARPAPRPRASDA
jgi:hypothetical protein